MASTTLVSKTVVVSPEVAAAKKSIVLALKGDNVVGRVTYLLSGRFSDQKKPGFAEACRDAQRWLEKTFRTEAKALVNLPAGFTFFDAMAKLVSAHFAQKTPVVAAKPETVAVNPWELIAKAAYTAAVAQVEANTENQKEVIDPNMRQCHVCHSCFDITEGCASCIAQTARDEADLDAANAERHTPSGFPTITRKQSIFDNSEV